MSQWQKLRFSGGAKGRRKQVSKQRKKEGGEGEGEGETSQIGGSDWTMGRVSEGRTGFPIGKQTPA